MEAREAAAPGPGRPSSGAHDRILQAALEVLETDGYAGLTTAKVAARAGHNKALIAYHYGSKEGLVTAASRAVSISFTEELVEAVGEPRTAVALVRALAEGMWRIIERDQPFARVYFDLSSQAMLKPEVRAVTQEIKERHQRTLEELLGRIADGPPPRRRAGAAVFLLAGLQGLALERLDRGPSAALDCARELFVRTAPAAIRPR